MSDLLSLGTSALNSAQRMLDTVGHNISNVHTPGYSRQVTELTTRAPIRSGNGYLGTGVDVSTTRRILDEFVNRSLTLNVSINQELNTFYNYVKDVDNLLADSNLGLSKTLDNFFTALNEANSHPESIPARQVFISQAEVLDSRLKELDSQLSNLQSQSNSQIKSSVTEINGIAASIAQINVDIINSGQSTSRVPNDLLDQRDQLISKLSKIVTVTTSEQDDGSLNVFIGTGQPLVIAGTKNTLSVKVNDMNSQKLDIAMGNGVSSVIVTSNITGGQLGGALSMTDSVIRPSQNALGRIALSIALSFNDQHRKGVDLNGNLGKDIFQDPNAYNLTSQRVSKSSSNLGTAQLSVTIDSVKAQQYPVDVFSLASNLVNSGSLSTITAGNELSLNGVNIRATLASDDLLSSSDATSSAISLAAAINASTSQHHVSASAQPNTLNLGVFTSGALASGEFRINGSSVVTTGVDSTQLIQDINALTSQTGVKASQDESGNIILVALDGRNIQLESNTNTPVATFSFFDTNSATSLNQVKRSEVHLNSQRDPIVVGGLTPVVAGLSVGSFPETPQSLTTSDYQLTYDGANYSLVRLSDNRTLGFSSTPDFHVDGFQIKLDGGSAQAGDKFLIQPTRRGAADFKMTLLKPSELALASPVRVEGKIENQGNAQISLLSIMDTSGTPTSTSSILGNAFSTDRVLTPPIEIEFTSDTQYVVYDVSSGGRKQIGPPQIFNVNQSNSIFPLCGLVDSTAPGPNPTYTYDPGYRVSIQGTPKQGDVFTISYNTDGSSSNGNGMKLTDLQLGRLMNEQSSSFQESFAQLVGQVGSLTSRSKVNSEASDSLVRALESRRNEISGVNLDEEAASLIKFEQYYQAAAQLIAVARQMFETLINSFGR